MNKMNKARKKITALLLTGCLCVAMLGSYALASTEYKVVSGDGGTYVKGSGEDYPLVIEGSIKDFTGVEVDKSEITPDQDCTVTGVVPEETSTIETPETTETPTTEAPETTEVTETTETPTTEAPEIIDPPTTDGGDKEGSTENSTEKPAPTEDSNEGSNEDSNEGSNEDSNEGSNEDSNEGSNEDIEKEKIAARFLFGAKQVQAATVTVTVTLKSSYLETLSVGTHEIAINFEDGSAVATLNIEDQEATTEKPEETTTATSTESSTSIDDGTGSDGNNDSNNKTTTSDSAKTGDSTPIGIFLALAVCSGAVIVYFGRKKVTK